MENKYIKRKLIGKDLFTMSKIINKMELKKELGGIVKEATLETQEAAAIQAGMEMITIIIGNIYKAEKEVNNFLGNLCGCTGEEFGEKSLTEIIEVIEELTKQDDIVGFLQQVKRLIGQ
ncbi:hypothetical protein [Clostridium sp. 1001270J_160509_D11]|uniref:hypothetical protein n=1 Tax=Clostridium sp. 1001270J_160509_D11 TaxID=2787103 RepID=UPI0018ABCD10|nr:hypothetical protein [Clostridium sp. 1001270J_160509_D11]